MRGGILAFNLNLFSSHIKKPLQKMKINTVDILMLASIILVTPHLILALLALKQKRNLKPFLLKSIQYSCPRTTILIPVKNEPFEIVHQTLKACKKYVLDKICIDVVLVDNSTNKDLSHAYNDLVEQLGFKYIFVGACKNKAEALNKALVHVKTELFIVLDADQHPIVNFFERLIPRIMADDNIAIVQTPQVFESTNSFEKVIATHEKIFYELIMPFRDRYGASICVGTNFIAKTKIIREVGGFSEDTATEDIDLSWKLVSNGYSIQYLQETMFQGLPPATLSAYLAQRRRYARGAALLFKKVFFKWAFLKSAKLKRKNIVLWLFYVQASLWYFTGFVNLFMIFSLFVYPQTISFFSSFISVIMLTMLLISTYTLARVCGIKNTILAQIFIMSTSIQFPLGIIEATWNPSSFYPSKKIRKVSSRYSSFSLSGYIGIVFIFLGCLSIWQMINYGINTFFHLQTSTFLLYGIIYLYPDLLESKSRQQKKGR